MKRRIITFWVALYLAAGAAYAQTTVNILNVTDGSAGAGWSFNEPVLTVGNGANITITGTVSNGRRVVVNGTVNITIDNLSISNTGNFSPIALGAGANATITLQGTSVLRTSVSETSDGAGIRTDAATLTINGPGTLTANGSNLNAGIGGNIGDNSGGNITINGGTVTANGGNGAAGIGGGINANGGNITINGGTVTANGGSNAAGIGGGLDGNGNITIKGGTVTANGGSNAAGIGGGRNGSAAITIKGGTVTATGGSNAAGIGGGRNGSAATVTITGGSVKASRVDPPTCDGSTPVYLATLTVGSVADGTALTAANVDGLPYDVTDVKVRDGGKVYFWLPAGEIRPEVQVGGTYYGATYTQDANNNNNTHTLPQLTPVNLSATQDGGTSGTVSSTGITLTFDADVSSWLSINDISLRNGTGAAVKGTSLTDNGGGMNWTLALTGVTTQGDILLGVRGDGNVGMAGTPQTVTVYRDNIPPAPGGSGVVTTTGDVTPASIRLDWVTAVDASTSTTALKYYVYRKASGDFAYDGGGLPTDGTLLNGVGGSTNIATYTAIGLTHTTTYYFCVVVEDATGNRSAYTTASQATDPAIYTATVSAPGHGGTHTFSTASLGYANNTAMAQTFTLTNAGNLPLTTVAAALAGGTGSAFEISAALSSATLNVGGTATLSVHPKAGLAVGTHTDVLHMTAANGVALSVNLSFTVNAAISTTVNGISVGTFVGGSVTVNKPSAQAGESVRLLVDPANGYTLYSLSVFKTGDTGTSVALSGRDDVYTFVMPAYGVTVTAHFLPLPSPPSVLRPVTLTLPAGIASQPAAGTYRIPSGSDLVFTLTLPSGQAPTVKTDRLIQGEPEVLTALPNADGSYTYTVRQVRQMLEITVTSSVGNADVATSEVWSHGGKLYVRASKSYTLYIYTLAGQLYKQQAMEAGETAIDLPQGFYIVVMDGKRWKVMND